MGELHSTEGDRMVIPVHDWDDWAGVPPPQQITEPQLGAIVTAFEQVFPDAYGYTDPDTFNEKVQTYLVFRNRDESFDKGNAIASIKYNWFGTGQ